MAGNKWFQINAGLLAYDKAMNLQLRLLDARIQGRLAMDAVIWLEHPPVFTLGLRGGRENLLVSEAFLESQGIPVIPTRRGGNITYHGPGQLIAYPIIDLNAARMRVTEYIDLLETVMLKTCADFGVIAGRNPANRGVWVADCKLGSIGVAVRKGVCFHGMALNVNTLLTPFDWIHPCGLTRTSMTTLAAVTRKEIPLAQARQSAQDHMADVFHRLNVQLKTADIEALMQSPEMTLCR